MINTISSFLALWIVIGYVGILANMERAFAADQTGDIIPRHIEYGFTLHNTTNRVIARADLWTYAPVQHTGTQQRTHLEASFPFQELSDEAGNSILHFTVQNLPPYAAKIITIRADLLLCTALPGCLPRHRVCAGHPCVCQPQHTRCLERQPGCHERLLSDTPLPEKSESATPSLRDLSPQPYCESDEPEIRQLARQLQTGDPLRTAEQIFRWVTENIEYSGYLKHPRGARYALTYKQGDCTEFMYLFVALCRAAGIPARGLGGYVVTKNTMLRPAEYHNWAEFYVDGVWYLADPQRKVFMQHQSHYLVMQVISADDDDHPMQRYPRFRYTGEGLNVNMN